MDSIYTSGDHLKGGGLLGGVSTLQETGLTGPISIYKLVPKVELIENALDHIPDKDCTTCCIRFSGWKNIIICNMHPYIIFHNSGTLL